MTNHLIIHARQLRKNITYAEKKLWHHLRKKQTADLRFRRQVPIGNYIADFLCLDPKIIIEIDGGQHNEEQVKQYDQKRSQWLQSRGYRVLRFWNYQVMNSIEEVMEEILYQCLIPPS